MSDNSNSNANNGGIGFCGLLTVLFIGLKLTNYIQWSWLWVLSPLWIPFAIVISILFVVGVVWLTVLSTATIVDYYGAKRRRAKFRKVLHDEK